MVSNKLISLVDSQQHLPQLARWFHAEWAYLHPGHTLQDRIQELSTYLRRDLLPECYVMEDAKGNLIGSASIVNCDMDTREDLFPWLASVYVDPLRRKEGLGSKIVTATIKKAHDMGFEKLFLFTPNQAPWYAKMGWQTLERTNYHGAPVTLMSLRHYDQESLDP